MNLEVKSLLNAVSRFRFGVLSVLFAGALLQSVTGAAMLPASEEDVTHRRPDFTWPAVSGAEWYQIVIQRNGQPYYRGWVEEPTWTPEVNGLPGGNYQWWVRSWGPEIRLGSWSSGVRFSIPVRVPDAVTLISPTGVHEDFDPSFRWQLDAHATWYQVWVSHPAGGGWYLGWHPFAGEGEAMITLPGHPGGESSWWVRPWGPDGLGPWSQPLSFSMPESSVVTMMTNLGEIKISLYPDRAPVTVANFLAYVDEGFYDGTIFHRVIPNFVIQGGGFDANMEQKPTRNPIVNEADNGLQNVRGTLAMARTMVVNSATSQFFINLVDNPSLNHTSPDAMGFGYAVFGSVIDGMDVVDRIAQVQTGTSGPHGDVPIEPVVIQWIRRE